MTEIGMALANPLEGERRPGYVGVPLPGFQEHYQQIAQPFAWKFTRRDLDRLLAR